VNDLEVLGKGRDETKPYIDTKDNTVNQGGQVDNKPTKPKTNVTQYDREV